MADGSTLGPTNDVYLQFQREHPKEAERVRTLVQEGRQRLESGQPDEARNRFMRALAIFPHIPAALTNLAALAMQQNNLDQAEEYIGQVLHHFPNDPAAHAVAARLWLQREVHPYVRYHARQAVRGMAHLQTHAELLAEDPRCSSGSRDRFVDARIVPGRRFGGGIVCVDARRSVERKRLDHHRDRPVQFG